MSSKKERTRSYSSQIREQRADETRQRIAEVARRMFLAHGFDGTTVDAIAREAGVATPTVYAAFRSKRGIVAEILKRARFGPGYHELVKEALAEKAPEARLRFTARIARQVFDAERSEMELLRGAGVVSPDLSDAEQERSRYEAQKKLVDFLSSTGRLRKGLDTTKARDILYALTGRDIYRQLVVERGWESSQYERWLADTLVLLLFEPE